MRQNRLWYLLLAIYFIFIGGGAYFATSLSVRIAHHVIVSVLAVIWLGRRVHRGQGLSRTPLNAPILAGIAVWGVATLLSQDVRMSIEHVWLLLTHVWLFYVIVDIIQRGYQRMIFEIVAFIGAIVVMLMGLELGSWYFGLGITPGTVVGWASEGRLPTLSDLPTLALALSVSTLQAGFTAPLVIVTIGWALTTPHRPYRRVLLGLGVLLMLALLLTKSRGGLLSLVAASGVLMIFYLTRQPQVTRYIPRRMIIAGGVTLSALGLVGLVLLTLPFGIGASNAQRLDMFSSAVEMTIDHPVTGVGVGMFGRAFRMYRDPAIAQDKLASAHNLYLNTLAETGVIGGIVGVWLLVAFGRAAWHNWQSARYRGHQRRIEIVLAALAGLAVHSMVEVFSVTPLVLLILVLAAYAIIPLPKSRLDPVPQGARLPLIALLAGFIAHALLFIPLDYANYRYQRSLAQTSLTDALANVQVAQRFDPFLRLYSLHEAHLRGQMSDRASAITAYERALDLEPTWDIGWVNLGYLEEQRGNIDRALTYYANAMAIDERNVTAYVNWARLAEASDSAEEALIVDRYLHAIQRQRRAHLPTSEFWYATALRQRVIQMYVSEARIDAGYRTLLAHDPDLARTIVPDDPQSWADWWVIGEDRLRFQDDPQGAIQAFDQALALVENPRTAGDIYTSRARAWLVLDPQRAEDDALRAQTMRTTFSFPNLVRAELVDDPDRRRDLKIDALRLLVERQEFAATLYNRPAVFEYLQGARYPGYGGEAIQAWLDVAFTYLEQGDTEAARRGFVFILSQAPYNSTAQRALDQLNAPE